MSTIDPPRILPIDHLSVSSLMLLAQCPQKWYRRYMLREYEPPNGTLILGSAIHGAEAQHYGRIVESGDGLSTSEVLDEFSDEWDHRLQYEEDIDWGNDRPGELKDSGAGALAAYHHDIALNTFPVSVERQFELSWPGVDWTLLGYLDLETTDGAVNDLKVMGKSLAKSEPNSALQPSAYMYARRAEQNPAPGFNYHLMVRTKTPYAKVVSTIRTDRQLDAFADRVFMAAREIAWRAENDHWSYAPPGAWWCGYTTCGYWAGCAGGGLK